MLHYEGGVSNHVNDSGGLTSHGVTQRTYDSYRKGMGLPAQPVTSITQTEIHSIYVKYWKCSGASRYNNEYGYHLFDTAVMSGCQVAKNIDKEVGGDLSKMVARRKLRFDRIVNSRPKNRVFYEGWLNRLYSIDDTLAFLK